MKANLLVLALLAVILFGCSGGAGNPAVPSTYGNPTIERISVRSNRILLSVGEIMFSDDRQSVEIIPERNLAMHLNILPFIEQCSDCIWFSDFIIYSDTDFSCDVKLKHPLPSLPQYTIFDMRFIFITDADYTFPSSGMKISFDGSNPRIMNPSGFTTLFNPNDFPYNEDTPILTYFPGVASFGDDFSATLNPFLSFGDYNQRRMIASGEEAHRRARLHTPPGPLKFGYAVDACWFEVDDWDNPVKDFPPEANCLEAYSINPIMSTWPEPGGSAPISVIVYDHQGVSTVSTVHVEAPGLFNGISALNQSAAWENAVEYSGTIFNDLGGSPADSPLLVRVIDIDADEYSGQIDAWQALFAPTEGNLIWAEGGGGYDIDRGTGITALSDDSIVVTGQFRVSSVFGKGDPNQTILTSAGQRDILIARWNPDGTLAWAKRAGGIITDYGFGITTLSDDSVVVTGWFYSNPVIFGKGEPNETSLIAIGDGDMFIARYNPDGTLAWAKNAGGALNDGGNGIIALSDDSTIVTGSFWETGIFGKDEPNETSLIAEGGTDIFIARYNADGSLAWAKRAGGIGNDRGMEITVLADDSTMVTGHFNNSATFGEGEPNETVLTSVNDTDAFIARYNPDGTLAWVVSIEGGGAGWVMGNGITALSDDSTVVTGGFEVSVIFGKGEPNQTVLTSEGSVDVFVARYNPDGTLVWAERSGGFSNDYGYEIKTLSDNSTVVTGRFGAPSTGIGDVFVARYDPDGNALWATSGGGDFVDEGTGITVLSDDSVVVTGYFDTIATFGLGEPHEIKLISGGATDVLIARFGP